MKRRGITFVVVVLLMLGIFAIAAQAADMPGPVKAPVKVLVSNVQPTLNLDRPTIKTDAIKIVADGQTSQGNAYQLAAVTPENAAQLTAQLGADAACCGIDITSKSYPVTLISGKWNVGRASITYIWYDAKTNTFTKKTMPGSADQEQKVNTPIALSMMAVGGEVADNWVFANGGAWANGAGWATLDIGYWGMTDATPADMAANVTGALVLKDWLPGISTWARYTIAAPLIGLQYGVARLNPEHQEYLAVVDAASKIN